MSRPLHLAEVSVRWPPETFLQTKLEGLARRGFRITLYSTSVFDPGFRLEGVELVRVPSGPGSRREAVQKVLRHGPPAFARHPLRMVRLLRAIRRDVPKRLRPRYQGLPGLLAMYMPLLGLRADVVQFEWHSAAVRYLPLWRIWGCPVVTSSRGSDLSVHPYVPGFEHYAARLPDALSRTAAVHCVSASLRDEAVELGLDPAKAVVIRPTIDPSLFTPVSRNGKDGRDTLRVVTLGWLRWEKGHEYALEAVRLLAARGVPVQAEILGSVPEEYAGQLGERERILHTIDDLGLDEHARLRPYSGPADTSRRLGSADVLLHAAVTEGIPNAVLEAMGAGLPVVATRCGGVEEAIRDGVEGFVVDPRDPIALADALERLWDDPALRARMGEAARERILAAGHTLEEEIDAFETLYLEVAGR